MAKSNEKLNTKVWLIFVAVFLISMGLLFVLTIDKPIGDEYKPVYEYGGDFVLKNHTGDVALADQRGKVVVLYFGFLSCTEACPVSLGTIVGAIRKLTPEEREKLQVFFISVDPARDDLKSLQQFASFYEKLFAKEKNPNMIMAITGSQEEVDKVTDMYGVYFDLVDLEGSGLGYTVDHSSRFYMIDGDGQLVNQNFAI